MSRNVPMDKPLSDDDRAYLLARGRDDTVAMIDARNPAKDELSEEEQSALVQQTQGTDDDDEAEADNYDDNTAWTYADLQAEAGRRGLPKSGSREDLVTRLREHDATQ